MEHDSRHLTAEIVELIKDKLLVEVGLPEEDLLVSGVLDSLTLVQLLVDMEQHFHITIPLEELEIDDFRSAASLSRMIEKRMLVQSPAIGTSVTNDLPLAAYAERTAEGAGLL
jgi:acyl carrier protein